MSELASILFVEDDKTTRHLYRRKLDKSFLVLESSSCKRSLEILASYKTHAILMDLNLPDGCGLEFIKRVREYSKIPIIVLSGEKDDQKKVKSFELGADDFVEKTCSPDLLIARIQAHLRRQKEIVAAPTNQKLVTGFCEWQINPLEFQIYNDDNKSANLSIREFRLLEYLIKNSGRALSREELSEAIREANYVPTARAIDVMIARIRKKIGENNADPDIIKTMRGIGYMFNKGKINAE